MRQRQTLYAAVLALFLFLVTPALAQEKLLTLDELYDPAPAKRVDFSGTPPSPRWLRDGEHYLLSSGRGRGGAAGGRPGLMRVDARTSSTRGRCRRRSPRFRA